MLIHPTCLLRNLFAGQEATVRTGYVTTDGSRSGEEYVKAVYCHPAYLTYIQNTSCKMPGWRKHKLESKLPEEILRTSDMQMTDITLKESKELKSLLIKVKGEWKSWLETQYSENEDHGIWPHLFMANRWGNNGNRDYFGGLLNHCRWWLQPWN